MEGFLQGYGSDVLLLKTVRVVFFLKKSMQNKQNHNGLLSTFSRDVQSLFEVFMDECIKKSCNVRDIGMLGCCLRTW